MARFSREALLCRGEGGEKGVAVKVMKSESGWRCVVGGKRKDVLHLRDAPWHAGLARTMLESASAM